MLYPIFLTGQTFLSDFLYLTHIFTHFLAQKKKKEKKKKKKKKKQFLLTKVRIKSGSGIELVKLEQGDKN